jgi:hypothetical protein
MAGKRTLSDQVLHFRLPNVPTGDIRATTNSTAVIHSTAWPAPKTISSRLIAHSFARAMRPKRMRARPRFKNENAAVHFVTATHRRLVPLVGGP